MNWYYVSEGRQAGPVEEAALDSMAASGVIGADTLVWAEGMGDWRPYGEARPGRAASGTAVAAPPVVGPGGGQVVCSECGKVFPEDETIAYGQARVCAACKPLFVQKVGEGLNVVGLNYAGFWIRFAAVFLDGILLGVVSQLFRIPALLMVGGSPGLGYNNPSASAGVIIVGLVMTLLQLALALSYESFMIGKYGATLGKMACKLRVVAPDGSKIGYGRAIGRYFAKILSSFTCLIGYIMAAFDDEKRALHDRICATRVIVKS